MDVSKYPRITGGTVAITIVRRIKSRRPQVGRTELRKWFNSAVSAIGPSVTFQLTLKWFNLLSHTQDLRPDVMPKVQGQTLRFLPDWRLFWRRVLRKLSSPELDNLFEKFSEFVDSISYYHLAPLPALSTIHPSRTSNVTWRESRKSTASPLETKKQIDSSMASTRPKWNGQAGTEEILVDIRAQMNRLEEGLSTPANTLSRLLFRTKQARMRAGVAARFREIGKHDGDTWQKRFEVFGRLMHALELLEKSRVVNTILWISYLAKVLLDSMGGANMARFGFSGQPTTSRASRCRL